MNKLAGLSMMLALGAVAEPVLAQQDPEALDRERQAQEQIEQQVKERQLVEQQARQQMEQAKQLVAQAEQQMAQARQLGEQGQQQAARQQVQRAQLEQAKAQLEAARAQLEIAAQQIAVRDLPGTYVNVLPGFQRLNGQPIQALTGPRAQIGAVIVDAEGGALVTQVAPGGAAADAGLKVGDVIEKIGDVDLREEGGSPNVAFMRELADVEPGDAVNLEVERAGRHVDVDVETTQGNFNLFRAFNPGQNEFFVLNGENGARGAGGNRPATVMSGPFGYVSRAVGIASSPWGDMELVPMTEGLSRYFDSDEGLLVVRGPSDDAIDIEDGDVILTIGGRTPNSPEHAIRILGSFEPGETIEFSLMRRGRRNSVEYTVPEGSSAFNPVVITRPAAPVAAAPGGQPAQAPAPTRTVPVVVDPPAER